MSGGKAPEQPAHGVAWGEQRGSNLTVLTFITKGRDKDDDNNLVTSSILHVKYVGACLLCALDLLRQCLEVLHVVAWRKEVVKWITLV